MHESQPYSNQMTINENFWIITFIELCHLETRKSTQILLSHHLYIITVLQFLRIMRLNLVCSMKSLKIRAFEQLSHKAFWEEKKSDNLFIGVQKMRVLQLPAHTRFIQLNLEVSMCKTLESLRKLNIFEIFEYSNVNIVLRCLSKKENAERF